MQLDTVTVFGRDTFRFESNKTDEPFSNGLLSIDTNGNVLWGKYITTANFYYGNTFMSIPTPKYISGMPTNGSFVYDDTDTITTGIGSCPFNCTDYYRNIMHIDANGNYITSFTAHLGSINQNVYAEAAPSGAIDWRGNLYLGGSITNYMSTTVGSVNNTDAASGNFFIAKIGISSCSCPTPGVQFTQVVKGDTVYFYGSSINQSDSIHWEFGDGTISNHDSLIHVYSQNGTYTVTAIAYDNCGVDSITKQITVRNVGITAIEPDKTSLYPNPVSNSVNIDVSGAATIGLISANGTMLWNEPKQINQVGTYVFDVSKYSSGVYYFIVQYSNGKTEVLQVVKE
jgi:PKD repeat protein